MHPAERPGVWSLEVDLAAQSTAPIRIFASRAFAEEMGRRLAPLEAFPTTGDAGTRA